MGAIVNKRKLKRPGTLLSGTVERTAGSQEVRVRDVSPEGALLEGDNLPPVDECVRLSCGTSNVLCQIAWIDGSWCGVQFLQPLAGTLSHQIGSRLSVSAPRLYRHDRPLTEDEPVSGVFRNILRPRPV